MKLDPEITAEKHPNTCYSLALVDYDSQTIYLGTDVHPEDVEEYIEDTLTHEYMHYVFFKHFGMEVAKAYERVYGEVELKGRLIVIGVQGVDH